MPYLRAHVWPREDEGKKVVGFKFFPFHGQWLPSEPRMEDAIARFRNIRVLRIIRENLLDVMISHLMAKRDCSWISLKPGTRQEPLAIPYEVCVSWLVGLEREREEATRRFARFPMLTITYNEVAYHNVRCMKSVQAWLGVEARVLKPQFPPHKQRIIPRHEAILDFEGLRAQIARTHPQWLRFFDEPEPFIGADHSASAHATATMP